MMTLIAEAGAAAWVSLALFLIGLGAVASFGRRIARPGSVAAGFAVAVLASGALGAATGQRMVDLAVHSAPADDLNARLEFLTVGTREATANLLLAGLAALVLLLIGGLLALAIARRANVEPHA